MENRKRNTSKVRASEISKIKKVLRAGRPRTIRELELLTGVCIANLHKHLSYLQKTDVLKIVCYNVCPVSKQSGDGFYTWSFVYDGGY